MGTAYKTERHPILIVFDEKAPYKDTYAGEIGRIALRAHLRPPLSCLSVGAPVKVVSWGSEPSAEVGMVDGLRTFEAGCGTVTAVPVGGLPQ